jgi:hypothetical protein
MGRGVVVGGVVVKARWCIMLEFVEAELGNFLVLVVL